MRSHVTGAVCPPGRQPSAFRGGYTAAGTRLALDPVMAKAFQVMVFMAAFAILACESRPKSATPDGVRTDAGTLGDGVSGDSVADDSPPPGWPADAGPAEVTAPPVDPAKENPLPPTTPPEQMP